jgi:hypothetical protein
MSWGAIVAGALAAIGVTVFLVALGSALGLQSVSPWRSASASAAAIGTGAAIWIVLTQWIASAFGGYLTGRLRTKWAAMGTDEVLFRDTAHGFLAWAVGTVLVFLFAASLAGGGVSAVATVASGAAQGGVAAASDEPVASYVDTLFRPAATETPAEATPAEPAASAAASTPPAASAASAAPSSRAASDESGRAETGRLLMRSMASDMTPEDRSYLAQMVAERTGMSQADAEARVDQVSATIKENAETARQAAASFAFITALSLAVGAFVAAAAGALGGRHRDEI